MSYNVSFQRPLPHKLMFTCNLHLYFGFTCRVPQVPWAPLAKMVPVECQAPLVLLVLVVEVEKLALL